VSRHHFKLIAAETARRRGRPIEHSRSTSKNFEPKLPAASLGAESTTVTSTPL
jgi:hypothetical protein